jgi:hypothetical protein
MTTVLRQPQSLADDLTRPEPRQMTPGPRVRSWIARHDGFVAFLVYLAVSLIWYRSVVAHMGSNCACGLAHDPGDNADFIWWFEWFVHALGNGLPLLHSTAIWAPTGINLAGTTATPLLAFLAAPLTLLWGPIPAFNLVMIMAPTLSAWGANRLCRHLTGSPMASLLAGVTFGFSSYEIGQLVGHPQMVVMVCPPLAALFAVRLLDGTLSPRRYAVLMSLVLIAQILLSVEVAFTMTIAGALALGAAWGTGTPEQRRRIAKRLRPLALPWLIAGILTSYYTLQVLSAPSYAGGVGARYPTDALSFFIPMSYTWLGGGSFAWLSGRFPAGINETGAYLGIPMLLIIGHYLHTRWQTRTARVLGVVLALLTLWIIGPRLWLAGRATLILPYEFIAKLPLFDEMMQGRIAVYLALAAAVTFATWLAMPHKRGRKHSVLRWTCGALVVVSVLPNLASPSAHNVGTWTRPRFFFSQEYRRYLRRGESILPIPWGYTSESYAWQAQDHMYWNMANGYWVFYPLASWTNKVTDALWWNEPRTSDGPLLRDLIVKRHVADVVVLDSYIALWGRTLQAAGLHVTARVGGVTLYHVPRGWSAPASTSAAARA